MFILLSIFFLVAAEARDDVSALVSSFETPLRALREDFAAQEEKVSMLTTKVADDRATSERDASEIAGGAFGAHGGAGDEKRGAKK